MSGLYLSKLNGNYIISELQTPIAPILNAHQTADVSAITSGKQMNINLQFNRK